MDDEFTTVSSWYGPGNVIAWYLLGFSVLGTWVCNRHFGLEEDWKDPDFIAFLTYPAIAAGDALIRSRAMWRIIKDIIETTGEVIPSETDMQTFRAGEAPYCVVQAFLNFRPYFFGVAISRISAGQVSLNRVRLVTVVYVLCTILNNRVQPKWSEVKHLTDDHVLGHLLAASSFRTFIPILFTLGSYFVVELGEMKEETWILYSFFPFAWHASQFLGLLVMLITGDSDFFWQKIRALAPRSSNSILELDQFMNLMMAVLIQILYKVWYFDKVFKKDVVSLRVASKRRWIMWFMTPTGELVVEDLLRRPVPMTKPSARSTLLTPAEFFRMRPVRQGSESELSQRKPRKRRIWVQYESRGSIEIMPEASDPGQDLTEQ